MPNKIYEEKCQQFGKINFAGGFMWRNRGKVLEWLSICQIVKYHAPFLFI